MPGYDFAIGVKNMNALLDEFTEHSQEINDYLDSIYNAVILKDVIRMNKLLKLDSSYKELLQTNKDIFIQLSS